MGRELLPCGTNAGYARHYRRGEVPCEACREGHLAYAARRWGKAERWNRGTLPCGTHAAYVRHYRHGELPCDACREAHAVYQRRRRWRS